MTRTIAVFGLFTIASIGFAEDWPAWRGPTGQGISSDKNLPSAWSATENIKWKVPLDNISNSTPIIWKDKIFLTQANTGGTVRSLLCLAKTDGRKLWQKDVAYETKEQNWTKDWYCNASPACDTDRVVVSFGSAGMFCYDHAGKELWKRTDLGLWTHQFGNASSPIFYGDTVILWCGPDTMNNQLLAVKKTTGETVWSMPEKEGSWGTPVVVNINNKDQILLGTGQYLKSYDAKTGAVLWFCEGLQSNIYTSVLYSKGIAVSLTGFNKSGLAVKVDGSGDITANRLWHQPKSTQRVGTGVIHGEHLYLVDENGVGHCHLLTTGEDLWKDEDRISSEQTWGSLLLANEKIYCLMKNGETVVFEANPKRKILSINSLGRGEQTHSSLAVADGEIFLRTFKNLYCIREKK